MADGTNRTKTRTVTTWGPSGTTGKTTFAVHTGAELGQRDNDVLVIDLDHQKGSLTSHIGRKDLKVKADPGYDHLGDVLLDHENRMDELIESHTNFDFVPAHEGLDNFEERVVQRGVTNREALLLSEIQALTDEYDYFIIDPPATLGILVDNALYAARNLLIPIELTEKGADTIEDVHGTVSMMEKGMQRDNPDFELSIMEIVPNFVRSSNIYSEIRKELESEGHQIADVELGFRDVLKNSWRNGMDLYEYAESNKTPDLRDYQKDAFDVFEYVADRMEGKQ